jgi:solute carrier family 25 (mitochondrial phosphate transporter), member 23/24/25/41
MFDNMIAGGLGGVVGKTCTAPLSRLTILYQLTPLLKASSMSGIVHGTLGPGERQGGAFVSLLKEAKHVARTEGPLAFWKGNLTSVLHRFPYSAINFSSYQAAKRVFERAGYEESAISRLVCGAYAGGMACAAAYPLDLVRTRLTIQSSSPKLSSTAKPIGFFGSSKILTIMSNIVAKEGFWGLYRGLTVSMAVAIPNLAIGFSTYDTVKEYFLLTEETGYFRNEASVVTDQPSSLHWVGALSSGAIGGVIASLIIFPFDVLRRRMQVIGILKPNAAPVTGTMGVPTRPTEKVIKPSAVKMFQEILRIEGVRGLYRGILPELLKVIPMVSVTFSVYELAMDRLKNGL